MLHTESVEDSTLELIMLLQDKEYLKGFYLVGGTAIALFIGHRKSVDIDLFSNFSFDETTLLENIHQDFNYQLSFTAANTLKGSIKRVKVDFLAHRYPYLNPPISMDGVDMLSLEDLIAMKLNAISTSGQRSKDFIDIYFLLEQYDIGQMLSFYQKKYGQQNDTFILKSLIYFDDVDLSDWPVLIVNSDLTWEAIKKELEIRVLEYARLNGL
ncbi:MAG TPA: nucleotidyl transferase AbiEii/AbiGii toxin family protein [Bacteroidales bacterium]|jgi:hypothetical protein|nr:nucleotidyl transferase AbiEii/AbiGii toxin family protein [Bacteroidales bacterium]